MNKISLLENLSSGARSSVSQYQHMFVGGRSLWLLMMYEICVSWVGPIPRALGYLLRKKCFALVLGKSGHGDLFGRSVILRCPGQIRLGDGVIVDDYVVLDAKGESSMIELGNQVLISRHSMLSCHDSRITMGNYISIGPFCAFASRSHIEIGSYVAIGSGVHIMAGTHDVDETSDVPIIMQTRISKGIVIQDNVWIGTGARILDGVHIGENTIVGAGSVVSRDVPANSMVLGNPARVIKTRKPVVGDSATA
jgi:acetyltransferase-like isoleucine patch superfamily enzyme